MDTCLHKDEIDTLRKQVAQLEAQVGRSGLLFNRELEIEDELDTCWILMTHFFTSKTFEPNSQTINDHKYMIKIATELSNSSTILHLTLSDFVRPRLVGRWFQIGQYSLGHKAKYTNRLFEINGFDPHTEICSIYVHDIPSSFIKFGIKHREQLQSQIVEKTEWALSYHKNTDEWVLEDVSDSYTLDIHMIHLSNETHLEELIDDWSGTYWIADEVFM